MIKLLTIICIVFIFCVGAFSFDRSIETPSTTVRESWAFSEDEIKEILINKLLMDGYDLRKRNVSILFEDCRFSWHAGCEPQIVISVNTKIDR